MSVVINPRLKTRPVPTARSAQISRANHPSTPRPTGGVLTGRLTPDLPTDRHEVMNTVLHSAFRRDLRRLAEVLRNPVGDRRRAALIGHVRFLLDQLHHHHTVEDEIIWPAVLLADPSLRPLFDDMAAEHSRLDWVVIRLASAADQWLVTGDDDRRTAVRLAAIDLETVLEPHLEHEESEAMPRIAAALTDRAWSVLDRRIRPKGSPAAVARQLFWMLDALDARRTAVVLEVVPPPVLRVLKLAFERREFRRARLLWD